MASLVEVVAPLVEVVLVAAGNSSNPIQISKHYYIKKAPILKGWRFFYMDFLLVCAGQIVIHKDTTTVLTNNNFLTHLNV